MSKIRGFAILAPILLALASGQVAGHGGEDHGPEAQPGPAIAPPISPEVRLTLSIGLAVADPVAEEQPGGLVARSGQALYRAKHAGRHRTCIWSANGAKLDPPV